MGNPCRFLARDRRVRREGAGGVSVEDIRSERIAKAEEGLAEVQEVLDHAKRAVDAADRAEQAAREASDHARSFARIAIIVAGWSSRWR